MRANSRPVRRRPAAGSWSAIVCADWSKEPGKREVYAASPSERRVWRLDPPAGGWDVAGVVAEAQRIRGGRRRPPLIGFDAPIGVARSYLGAVGARTFSAWLRRIRHAGAFEPGRTAAEWSLARPFFTVPKGKGSLKAFEARMRSLGVEPLRAIDGWAHAKSVFIAGGIPGAVGSAAIDVWRGLSRCRRRVALWPFDGRLGELGCGRKPVIAEIYPRLAYGLAISREPPSMRRVRLHVAKGRHDCRVSYLESLCGSDGWARKSGVDLQNVENAESSEDAFDAFVTAAALLRCVLERTPLSDARFEDAVAEGGILGSGSVCLDCRERAFRPGLECQISGPTDVSTIGRIGGRRLAGRSYECPVGPCHHVFRGSRGGWDAHVGSLRLHPSWHPEVTDPRVRRELFRKEFPGFFQ